MKTKQLLVLVGVFIVLALLVLILENPFGKSEEEQRVEAAEPLFPDFKKESVSKIELTVAGETTTLVKDGTQWLIASMDNYPADQEGVNELLDKVTEFKTIQRASTNPEKQSVFQVDSSGVEAKLLNPSDNVLAHVFVGKTTADFFNSYVRAADSNDVYVVEGYLKSVFDKGVRTWKDRTIFDFNTGDVTHLVIKSEAEEIELQVDAEGKWLILKPVPSAAKKTEADNVISTLSSLTTDDFAETKELSEYELNPPKSSITATLNDGTAKTLLIGKEESGKHYVKRPDKDTIFMLYKSRINQLIKKSEDLKDDTPITKTEVEGDSEAAIEEE